MKVSSSLTHQPQNNGPLNFFKIERKLHFNDYVSKLRICETFGLIELHNLSKVHLADRIFNYEKAVFTITGPVNIQLLKL